MWLSLFFLAILFAVVRFWKQRPVLLWAAFGLQALNATGLVAGSLSVQQSRHLTGWASLLYLLGLVVVMTRLRDDLEEQSRKRRAASDRLSEHIEWRIAGILHRAAPSERVQAMARIPERMQPTVQARLELLKTHGSAAVPDPQGWDDSYLGAFDTDLRGDPLLAAVVLVGFVPFLMMGMALVRVP